jgi:hypothetical protein
MVLLDLTTQEYHRLDPIGAEIWSLILAGRDTPYIANYICLQYDEDLAQISADVAGMIVQFRQKGWIVSESTEY